MLINLKCHTVNYIKNIHLILVFYLISLITTNTYAAQTVTLNQLPNFTATYKVKYLGIPVGEITRTLKTTSKNNYLLLDTVKSSLPFLNVDRKEFSKGVWGKNKIYPQQYGLEGYLQSEKNQTSVTFDWPNKQVHYTRKEQSGTMKITDGTLDKLSCQLALNIALLQNKQQFTCSFASGKNKIGRYYFTVLNEETLETDWGALRTLKIKQQKPNSNKRRTIFWVAKDYDYLLIRIAQYEKNLKKMEANLVTYQSKKYQFKKTSIKKNYRPKRKYDPRRRNKR